MNKTDKIQVLGLIVASLILLGCLAYGMKIKGQDSSANGLLIKAQEPYQARVYEDGSYVVQYNESQETETGCLDWGLCND